MSFNAGDLVATLRVAGLPQFEADTQRAGAAWTKLGQLGNEALRIAGTATGVLGTATAITTALLFKQGVEYNRLQQTSRAALTTMLGSAEKVNAQMAKLDEFARESPFSKSVFLSAQQQLLAFGVEAEKVIPYLDSIQNAVAAMGGSNNDIAELVTIMAQIKSSAKITGEDLLQFGQRGIDAATLIGSQMGKTGAQIREEITAGTLDAQVALDALAAGMQDRFGGAAANVKKTFDGMWDRIKAASRDIGSLLAKPFVDPNGGGALVIWGNQFADVLRGIQSKVGPIMDILTVRSAAVFRAVTDNLTRLNTVVRTFDPGKVVLFLNEVARYGPAAGAAIGLIGTYALSALPGLHMLAGGFMPLMGAVIGFVAASPELRDAVADILRAFTPLAPIVQQVADIMAGALTAAAPVLATVLGGVADALAAVLGIVAQIPTPILVAAGAFLALSKVGTPLLKFGEWMMGLGTRAVDLGQHFMTAYHQSGTFKGGLAGLLGAINPVSLAIMGATAALAIFIGLQVQAAQAAAAQQRAMEQWRDAYAETGTLTQRASDSLVRSQLDMREAAKFAKELGLSMETVVAAASGEGRAMAEVEAAVRRYNAAQIEAGNTRNLSEGFKQIGDDARRMAEGTSMAGQDLLDIINDVRTAQEEGARAAQEMRKAQREAFEAMGPEAQRLEGINTALATMRDTAADVPTKVNAIKEALRLLNSDGGESADDLTQSLNDTARSIEQIMEELEGAAARGEIAWEQIIGPTGKIDTRTSAGSQLRTQLELLNDEMLAAIVNADDMAKAQGRNKASFAEIEAAAKPYRDRLREIAEAAGVPPPLIDALVAQMLAIPDTVGFMLDDSGTVDASIVKLRDLANRVTTLPDGSVTIKENATETIETLRNMGFLVSEPHEGVVTITSNGIEDVKTALMNLEASDPEVDVFGIFHKPNTDMDPVKADVQIDAENITVNVGDAVKGPFKAEIKPKVTEPDDLPWYFGSSGGGGMGGGMSRGGMGAREVEIPVRVAVNDDAMDALHALSSKTFTARVVAFMDGADVITGFLRAIAAPRTVPLVLSIANYAWAAAALAALAAARVVPLILSITNAPWANAILDSTARTRIATFVASLPNVQWAEDVLTYLVRIRIATTIVSLPNATWADATLDWIARTRVATIAVSLPNATWANDTLNWVARARTAVMYASVAAGDSANATLDWIARPRTVRFVGDSDPSIVGFAAGSALSRVQAIMRTIPGLRITDTYSTPARDAYYGIVRSPNSYHYDRANPAVDVAGSYSALSAFVAALRRVGGWRQILWQVPGHYDHVHVAHGGGMVSPGWPRLPGDALDERTTRLRVGEVVLPERVARYLRSLAVPVGRGRPSGVPMSDIATTRPASDVTLTIVNPIARNVVEEAQEAADLIAAAQYV